MRTILKYISILVVKYLQKRYKSLSIKNEYNQSNQVLYKLKLIQSVLYYFKGQFKAWGYFHPDCGWSNEDEKFYRWLFPEKDFKEIPIVVWYNPEAVTYYSNKIYNLKSGKSTCFEDEIKRQLKKWRRWN